MLRLDRALVVFLARCSGLGQGGVVMVGLGDFGVSTLYWAPFALGAAFIVLASVSAPVLIEAAARRTALFRSGGRNPDALKRTTHTPEIDGRINLDLAAQPEFESIAQATAKRSSGFSKRAVDIMAALGLLVFFAPLLALVAVLIKLDSRGPILYRQRRVGLDGREFNILKFRSMVVDAEKDGGARWAKANDSRVTRIGRVIRKLRIDEMPQAVNILRGEMSFVGPRPERPEFVRLLEAEVPAYRLRHQVRPGLTGWAQVKYVYGASVEDARVKLQYDLYYIKHFALWRDIMIMLMTVRVALFGVGAR